MNQGKHLSIFKHAAHRKQLSAFKHGGGIRTLLSSVEVYVAAKQDTLGRASGRLPHVCKRGRRRACRACEQELNWFVHTSTDLAWHPQRLVAWRSESKLLMRVAAAEQELLRSL